MKENRFESFQELEIALNNLTALSDEIKLTFNELNQIYQEQSSGWESANSAKEAGKMKDYQSEALKIAENVNSVSEVINKFKTVSHNIDMQ